jgi:hypothetical protein
MRQIYRRSIESYLEPLVIFNADTSSCMDVARDCDSDTLSSDIRIWCSTAKIGDAKRFGKTVLICLDNPTFLIDGASYSMLTGALE